MGKYRIPFSIKLETADDKEWAKQHLAQIRAFIQLKAKGEFPCIYPKVYHAEVNEDRAKCPVGIYKNQWVTRSICRKCNETQCDIKR